MGILLRGEISEHERLLAGYCLRDLAAFCSAWTTA
jgi:hypothetical protein